MELCLVATRSSHSSSARRRLKCSDSDPNRTKVCNVGSRRVRLGLGKPGPCCSKGVLPFLDSYLHKTSGASLCATEGHDLIVDSSLTAVLSEKIDLVKEDQKQDASSDGLRPEEVLSI